MVKNGLVTPTQCMELRGKLNHIRADVPLSEMFGYATRLRSLTQGRGTFVMLPKEYRPVSEEIANKLLLM